LRGCDENAHLIRKRFDDLDTKIKEKLEECEKKTTDSRVRSLSSSSSRFTLIVLSYQILFEALNAYDEKIIENLSVDAWKSNDLSEERIKKSWIDKTDEIIGILIENLVMKLQKTKQQIHSNDNKLFEYILNNAGYFYSKQQGESAKDAAKTVMENPDKYIGFIGEQKDDEIILMTEMSYQLDQFWYMDVIPEPEKILQFIKEVNENVKTEGKTPSKIYQDAVNHGVNQYNTNGQYAQMNKKVNGQIEGRTNYSIQSLGKKNIDFYKKIVKYEKPVEEEDKGGES
jgi:hypothetical protein